MHDLIIKLMVVMFVLFVLAPLVVGSFVDKGCGKGGFDE